MSFAVIRDRIDLLFSPCFLVPLICPSRSMITIHDLTHVVFPEKHKAKHLFIYNTLLPHSIKSSNKIIAVSQNTKQDIIKIFNIPEEKVTVIYESANDIFKPVKGSESISKIKRKYGIPSKYILFVGTIEPRKNLIRLIEAFNLVKTRKNINYKLVIVGKKGWMYEDVFNSIKELGLENEIVFTDYIPEKDLVYIYNGADIFVYPSLYEGFGLPPLEAMSCGVPVVTSNTSSLPEVVGKAAVLIDPYDVKQLSDAIYWVLTNRGLRENLIGNGLRRARLFSWQKAARELSSVFNGSESLS